MKDTTIAVARYTKGFLPLSKVKEKEFLSRRMGCKGVGFSFVRYKPGEGATYVHRHKVQEEVFIIMRGTGSIVLDGKRMSMPEGDDDTCRSDGLSGPGNESKRDVVYMILGRFRRKTFRLEPCSLMAFPIGRKCRAGKNRRPSQLRRMRNLG